MLLQFPTSAGEIYTPKAEVIFSAFPIFLCASEIYTSKAEIIYYFYTSLQSSFARMFHTLWYKAVDSVPKTYLYHFHMDPIEEEERLTYIWAYYKYKNRSSFYIFVSSFASPLPQIHPLFVYYHKEHFCYHTSLYAACIVTICNIEG